VCASGRVVIHGEQCDLGPIVDVSITGVRVGLAGRATDHRAGDRVELELRFDGARGGWSELSGRVVRVDLDLDVVVAFDEPAAELADRIQDELLAALESETVEHVVLVDPVTSRRAEMAAMLRAAGRRVSEAATPLEAIALLGESCGHAQVIAIADTVPEAAADELRAYMAREHPRLRLVRATAAG